jgi:hypothetical protein
MLVGMLESQWQAGVFVGSQNYPELVCVCGLVYFHDT